MFLQFSTDTAEGRRAKFKKYYVVVIEDSKRDIYKKILHTVGETDGKGFFYNVFRLPTITPPPPLCELARPAEWGFEYMFITGQCKKYSIIL
jgi:hypothetical protein